MVSEGFQLFFLSNLKIYYLFIYLFFFIQKYNQQADINVTQKQENSKPDSNIQLLKFRRNHRTIFIL